MPSKPKTSTSAALFGPVLEQTLEEMQAQLDICRARREELPNGGFDPDLASAATSISRAITTLASEIRQQEKHEHRIIDAVTPAKRFENVLTYLEHEMEAVHRSEVRDLMDRLMAGEGLLS